MSLSVWLPLDLVHILANVHFILAEPNEARINNFLVTQIRQIQCQNQIRLVAQFSNSLFLK